MNRMKGDGKNNLPITLKKYHMKVRWILPFQEQIHMQTAVDRIISINYQPPWVQMEIANSEEGEKKDKGRFDRAEGFNWCIKHITLII
jgi:hypothetical protein